jgi:response regulator RpfG family c-di-GMP phosphodiesterase
MLHTDARVAPQPPSSPSQEPASARSILVVDDEAGVRELMSRWLLAVGFSVRTASSAEDALGVMGQEPAAVALCDIRMPGQDGLWLADRLRHDYPDTAVIMATALQDVDPAVKSLRYGVVDYLTKPFGRERLREAVCRGIDWHRSACDSRRWRDALEREMHTRQARLAGAISALRINSDETLDAMLAMLTLGDRDAYAHAYRVAALSVCVGRAMELSEAEIGVLERGALLHDIGKLAIPEALLQKPAPLTAEEQNLVRLHPAVGSALLADVPYLAAAAAVVRDAHERLDGRGFPHGSRDDSVWIGARIVTVTDAFDTMTRPRVFREAISPGDALAELDRCSGTQFDSRVVEAFKRINLER